jgi:dihydrofolate reductase
MSLKIENVEAILAVDENFGLAKNGKIPWKSSKDMFFFKNKTLNNVVVMGSKTLLSLPNSQPLKNRINIVVTNNYEKYFKLYYKYDNIFFFDIEEVIKILKQCYKDKIIFIIGGNQLYNTLLPYCSTIWLTKIKANYECDLIFNYDISNFEKTIIENDSELEIIQLN